jgi:hypothetical protein
MADLLNKKEDVIKFEFTSYGRRKLALGNFMPSYYYFFDDSIIYDASYMGQTEDPNNSKNRIFDSLTFGSLNLIDDTLLMPLGNSSIFNDYAPAWDLSFLKGEIIQRSTSSLYYKQIFDITPITYTAHIEKSALAEYGVQQVSAYDLPDGKTIVVDDDYILIDLSEINCEDEFKNFDVEIYAYDELNDKKIPRQLQFIQKQKNIIDGIIYEASELPLETTNISLNVDDVEYYFELLVDNEINFDLISGRRATVKEQIKNTYTTTSEDRPTKDQC